MANADPRSRGMFGAAYFVGYVANLGLQDGTRVDAVALGDAMGDRGLVSDCGTIKYPAYQVVQSLAAAATDPSAHLLWADSNVPGTVASLGVQFADPISGAVRRQLWLANLRPTPTTVAVEDSDAGKQCPATDLGMTMLSSCQTLAERESRVLTQLSAVACA